jgi:hypothetical protein
LTYTSGQHITEEELRASHIAIDEGEQEVDEEGSEDDSLFEFGVHED